MKITKKPEALKSLAWQVTECEYALQKAWKFDTDARWHKFGEMPGCKCPKMDNADGYPYQQYYSQDCPIHGEVTK